MNKENYPPRRKQGIQYQISTDKNNGVYLSKDIAHDNYLSLTLLTKEARDAHKSYVNTFLAVAKEHENKPVNSNKLSEVESFNENYRFCLKNLQKMRQQMWKCSQNNKIIRQELEGLKHNIQIKTSSLYQSAMPAFKNLKDKIKTHKSEQTATYSQMKREIGSIGQCLEIVENGLRQCERKTNISELKFGGRGSEALLQ